MVRDSWPIQIKELTADDSCLRMLPEVIDKSGQIRMRHVGFVGGEDLERTLLEKIDALR